MWIKDKDGCNIFDLMIKDVAPWVYEPVLNRMSSITIQRCDIATWVLFCSFFFYLTSSLNVHICSWNDLSKSNPNDLYTWGINENMTLAQTHQKSRKLPEIVNYFSGKKIVIRKVKSFILFFFFYFTS